MKVKFISPRVLFLENDKTLTESNNKEKSIKGKSSTGKSSSGGSGGTSTINAPAMLYLTNLTDRIATYVNSITVTTNALAAVNPVINQSATVNEFDIYINGQYIDKVAYTWTPSDISSQTITFDTVALGYTISADDLIVINGRWA